LEQTLTLTKKELDIARRESHIPRSPTRYTPEPCIVAYMGGTWDRDGTNEPEDGSSEGEQTRNELSERVIENEVFEDKPPQEEESI